MLVSSRRRLSRPNRVSTSLQSAGDGGKTNSSPGRARHKPSNHCAGNVGCSPLPCMLVCALSCPLHTGPRVQRAPGIPCALSLPRAKRSGKPRARCAARTLICVCSLEIDSIRPGPAREGIKACTGNRIPGTDTLPRRYPPRPRGHQFLPVLKRSVHPNPALSARITPPRRFMRTPP